MKVDTPEVAAARVNADRARARLLESVRAFEAPLLDLKTQLTPSHILGDAWEGAKSKGADLVEDAVDAVTARPLAATGIVAAITMFLAREPLLDLAGQLFDGASEKHKSRKRRKTPTQQDKTEASNDQLRNRARRARNGPQARDRSL